jgi:hypothetical protein
MSATPFGVALMHPSETYAFPPMHVKENKEMNFFIHGGNPESPPISENEVVNHFLK